MTRTTCGFSLTTSMKPGTSCSATPFRRKPSTLSSHTSPRRATSMKSRSSGEAIPYVCELTRRRYRKPPPAIRGPEDVGSLPTVRRLRTARREHFVVLLLNARHECTGVETVSVGSLNASIVHPREVMRPAIMASAASILLVHNHPRATPSLQKRTSRSPAGSLSAVSSSASGFWTT